jgi:glycosyltransferase involved in cell wall biosynthesis
VFEVIVVDGRSTDGTVDEAMALADRMIVGSDLACVNIAHARNLGADDASSPFLFHTDADVVVPDLGALLTRALREFDDPGVVAVTAPVMPYPWASTWRDYLIHRVANVYFRVALRFGVMLARGECQIVRRSAFEAIGGYDGSYISGEDCDLFQRLHHIGRIAYICDLCVYHSPRRFRQVGYMRMLGIYVREWVWMSVFRRSYVREWRVVR